MKYVKFLLVITIFSILMIKGLSYANEYKYYIGEGDLLEIYVWENQSLTRKIKVRPDGMISYPLIGDIKAAGLEPIELSLQLTKLLAEFITAPAVTVIVEEFISNKVYTIAEDGTSGVYNLQKRTTLLEFISIMGGLPSNIDLKKFFILRDGKKLEVDFEKLIRQRDISQNIYLEKNDTLFFPSNFKERVFIIGEVAQQRQLDYRDGLTILDAIFESGGTTEFANLKGIKIFRKPKYTDIEKDGQKDVKYTKIKANKLLKGSLNQMLKDDYDDVYDNEDGLEEYVAINMNLEEIKKGNILKEMFLQPGDIIVVP